MNSCTPPSPCPAGQQPESQPGQKTWHCGTLTYTKMGLVALFAFMIWGDFCNVVMQTVVPSIMPLKFKSLGASNFMIGIFSSTLPALLSTFMNPWISFKSDRFRSRWGRRIPFILMTLPPLTFCLVALAYGDEAAIFITKNVGLLSGFAPATVAVFTIGVLLVAFLFFDQFVNAVFCGLFSDVVPSAIMGRFMGVMRIVGSSSGMLYSWFVYKHAESHMKEIFLVAAALYFVGVGMMCLFVKESKHPEPSAEDLKKSRGLRAIKSYFTESFTHKFYWTKFLGNACGSMSWAGVGAFMIFFYKEMGLTLGDVGKVGAINAIMAIATAYFASVFVDRWHPVRIITYSTIFGVLFTVSNAVWLFLTLSPSAFFWLHMLGAGLIGGFSSCVTGVANLPYDMRLHPKSRFTQFCSAQTLTRSLCVMAAGALVGLFFDGLKWIFPNSEYAYRFWFVWVVFWNVLAAGFAYSLYRQWHELGGDKAFHVPAPWSPTGWEEHDHTPYVGPQSRWLNYNLIMVHAVMLLSVIYLIPLTYWLWKHGWTLDFEWHLYAIIPGSIVIYLTWLFMERALRKDMARCKAGEMPLSGIPHHGIFFLKACALLLLFGIWIGKTIAGLDTNQAGGILALGAGNLLTNALMLATFHILRRMERGHDPLLDYDGRKDPTVKV